ncbi:unnamed protein product [Protopolystoma xenopodis]|uniref:Uncharacterized protein n=1 Tax=Protopolystoma xenopodis TaxID=117903 RepID=A0A3S5C361_9PLAT|nr:unnamed protein product [Protopolystoma xenopodis]
MHLEMFLIAMVSLFFCQIILMTWKKYHFRSYQLVTLIAMVIVPIVYSLVSFFFRFVVVWFLFHLVTGSMVFLATRKRISTSTPRKVYWWFLFIHKITYILGVTGYFIVTLTIFGVNNMFYLSASTAMDIGLLLLFYGLYFGVISRDFAEVCSERMAAHIGQHILFNFTLYLFELIHIFTLFSTHRYKSPDAFPVFH